MIRYYVTDRRRGDILTCAERAVHDGVDLIQIREKDLPARELLELASRVRNLAAGTHTRVLVNDRLDIAIATAIGVHLPGNGLPPERVRGLASVVGISVHSLVEAVQAERAGVDFIVFGPVFDSPGKTAVGLEPLKNVAAAVKVPVLAIGGVTMINAGEALNAGAAGIAGIRLFQTI